MKIMKFGGSSLATPPRIEAAAGIALAAARREPVVLVVSALGGVTDALLLAAHLAESGDGAWRRHHAALMARHEAAARAVAGRGAGPLRRVLAALGQDLHEALHGMALLLDAPPRARDLAAGFGELLSAHVMAACLARRRPAVAVDARDLIVTDDQFTAANVLTGPTESAIRAFFGRRGRRAIPVVTGFIARTADGRPTTLGRNGSDYTASLLGAALGARVIEIWTDVDGVLSADPRQVPGAFTVPRLTYEEAMELSYFGAGVLHASTMAPAVARGIPLIIRNTLNPVAPGTIVSADRGTAAPLVRGISSVGAMTLLNLRGPGMAGVPGTSERLFRALAAQGVNVVLISQASSEHTICFAVGAVDAVRARRAIGREFRHETETGLIRLDEKPDQTIVALVGEGMRGTPGVAGRVFGALGRHGINVGAIAQGSSERNISFVVDSPALTRTLNVVHGAFFETKKRLDLVVVGVGNIGAELLAQLRGQRSFLLEQGFDVRVSGVADSRRFALDPAGLDLSRWRRTLAGAPAAPGIGALAARLAALPFTDVALVDCTASAEVVDAYPDFVRANCHIITPNKKANVLPEKRWRVLTRLLAGRQKLFLYEANVGAGLPVISTMRDLIASGDVILKIEGILSGTLSYLFNSYDGRRPFSAVLRAAHRRGLTEPDPREDLSGRDVARKLLILARQMGLPMNLGQVRTENLMPPPLRRGPFRPALFARMTPLDRAVERRFQAARAAGRVLRYVGRLEAGRARAGLQAVAEDHPFARVRGSDNILAFTTRRYAETPLVIQGPGAGAEVTAMGVFSDILKLLHALPE